MSNDKNPFIDKNPSYYEDEQAKALNKQGYASCCQILSAMKAYVNLNQEELSGEEKTWFCRYSYWFLTAIQEKLVICKECLDFYDEFDNWLREKLKENEVSTKED